MGKGDLEGIANPKLRPDSSDGWYDYYAGYSAAFARDAINALLDLDRGPGLVLDAWNGSGTTTVAASLGGHHAVGIDRNPALVVIAKGRHLPISVRGSLDPLASEITETAERLLGQQTTLAPTEDQLSLWFADASRQRLRAMQRAIDRILVDDAGRGAARSPRISTLAAFFYTALFTVVRKLTTPFRASNPTWIRQPDDADELLHVGWDQVAEAFSAAVSTLGNRLRIESEGTDSSVELRLGSADTLSLRRKAGLALGSPPYATRIDYVVATHPELATLGLSADQIQRLRHAMLGSPLSGTATHAFNPAWGVTAMRFLNAVRQHRSKASATYYYRYYVNYVRGLHASLVKLNTVTRRDGAIALVVQDSYYKELHFGLPRIVEEIGQSLERSAERVDYPVPRTMAAMHPGSRSYRSGFGAIESLVVLGT